MADWSASLLGKGLKVNAGKSKVMVGSRVRRRIVNSGKWPCGVCRKGVQEKLCSVPSMYTLGFTNDAVVCVVTVRG